IPERPSRHSPDPRIDRDAIVYFVEGIFGGPPTEGDRARKAAPSALEYAIDADGCDRLWVRDVEVSGIHRKDVQDMLRFFCENPETRCAGRALQKNAGLKIPNASEAAKILRSRLEDADSTAADWFTTGPLRWAEGCRPIRRKKNAGKPRSR